MYIICMFLKNEFCNLKPFKWKYILIGVVFHECLVEITRESLLYFIQTGKFNYNYTYIYKYKCNCNWICYVIIIIIIIISISISIILWEKHLQKGVGG